MSQPIGYTPGRRTLLVTFVLAIALITFEEIHDEHLVPRPRRYVSAGIVYGILGLLVEVAGPLAAALGVGLFVALVYQHYTTGTAGQLPNTGETAAPPAVSSSGNVGSSIADAINGLLDKLKGQ